LQAFFREGTLAKSNLLVISEHHQLRRVRHNISLDAAQGSEVIGSIAWSLLKLILLLAMFLPIKAARFMVFGMNILGWRSTIS
jgi:hypothetical protein